MHDVDSTYASDPVVRLVGHLYVFDHGKDYRSILFVAHQAQGPDMILAKSLQTRFDHRHAASYRAIQQTKVNPDSSNPARSSTKHPSKVTQDGSYHTSALSRQARDCSASNTSSAKSTSYLHAAKDVERFLVPTNPTDHVVSMRKATSNTFHWC